MARSRPRPPREKRIPISPSRDTSADALAKVIPERFPKPDFLIATKQSKGSNRPVETITPLANVLHETIDSRFNDKEFDQLAQDVLTNPQYAGKVLLISWHHGKIPDLAKALGAKDVPEKWGDDVFDRVWEIDYKNGTATWHDLPEHALPGDSDKAKASEGNGRP